MSFRHIMTGAMLCLLLNFINCDTMNDVNKMEKEMNNMTLVSVSGLSGGLVTSKVCYSGAIPLSLGGGYLKNVTFNNQNDYYVINITASGRLRITTTGTSKLIGYLYNPSCNEMISNGDWSGNIALESDVKASGNYWVWIWASASSGTNYAILSEMI